MKNIIIVRIIIVTLLSSLNALCQGQDSIVYSSCLIMKNGDTINKIDLDGIRIGPWLTISDDDFKASYYKENEMDGKEMIYREDDRSRLSKENNYKKGTLNGRQVQCWSSGIPYRIFYYKNGVLDGPETMFYMDGSLSSVSNFKNGKRDGKGLDYFKNGKIHIISFVTKGEESGTWVIYSRFFHMKKKEYDFDDQGNKVKIRRYFLGIKYLDKSY